MHKNIPKSFIYNILDQCILYESMYINLSKLEVLKNQDFDIDFRASYRLTCAQICKCLALIPSANMFKPIAYICKETI